MDGYRMRNVIIQNAQIYYSGKAVILDNVYFVNCTFQINLSSNSRSLGENLLASAAISFKAES